MLGLYAWVGVYVATRSGSTAVAISVLIATLLAVGLGVVAARSAERRSAAFFMGTFGAALGGLLLLQAALAIIFLLAGWSELR
ncbi:MAG TPA: hypothetical protein VIG93_05510 [Gaiellaceae bacterium]